MKSYDLENEIVPYTLTKADEQAFAQFCKEEKLSSKAIERFKIYIQELITWNEKFNITALTKVKEILLYHFQDSLKIREFIDIKIVTL